MQAPERKPTTALVFDSSIEGIGDSLALVTLLGFHSKNEARVTSVSVSRNDLKAAAYCDSLCRFFGVQLSIGMSESGRAADTVLPMISAVLASLDRIISQSPVPMGILPTRPARAK